MAEPKVTSVSMPDGRAERSVGELFGALASDASLLVRQEVRLATKELSQKAGYAAGKSVTVAVGAALGLLGAMALVAGLVLALGLVIPVWAAALAVGAVLGLAGYTVAQAGLQSLRRMELKPEQTLLSLQETKSWVQEQIR